MSECVRHMTSTSLHNAHTCAHSCHSASQVWRRDAVHIEHWRHLLAALHWLSCWTWTQADAELLHVRVFYCTLNLFFVCVLCSFIPCKLRTVDVCTCGQTLKSWVWLRFHTLSTGLQHNVRAWDLIIPKLPSVGMFRLYFGAIRCTAHILTEPLEGEGEADLMLIWSDICDVWG